MSLLGELGVQLGLLCELGRHLGLSVVKTAEGNLKTELGVDLWPIGGNIHSYL